VGRREGGRRGGWLDMLLELLLQADDNPCDDEDL